VSLGVPPDPGDERLVCSAKGCRQEALHALLWNNPKLHTAERRKVWLACEGHRSHLSEYLTVRGFLKGVIPVEELSATDG